MDLHAFRAQPDGPYPIQIGYSSTAGHCIVVDQQNFNVSPGTLSSYTVIYDTATKQTLWTGNRRVRLVYLHHYPELAAALRKLGAVTESLK